MIRLPAKDGKGRKKNRIALEHTSRKSNGHLASLNNKFAVRGGMVLIHGQMWQTEMEQKEKNKPAPQGWFETKLAMDVSSRSKMRILPEKEGPPATD